MKQNIKALPEELRPREKLLLFGENTLSDSELLAILLQSGTKEKNVIDLAQEVLIQSKGLMGLGEMTMASLSEINGIGISKACTILSMVELSRRLNSMGFAQKMKIRHPKEVVPIFLRMVTSWWQESFMVVYLDKAMQVIGKQELFKGQENLVMFTPKFIYQEALRHKANGIIIAHTHPSGLLMPSQADIKATKTLKEAGDIIDITLLDHLILNRTGEYYSFLENGLVLEKLR
mgnify:CR=1 FL=1|jgi:UPF0758 protein GTNG_2548